MTTPTPAQLAEWKRKDALLHADWERRNRAHVNAYKRRWRQLLRVCPCGCVVKNGGANSHRKTAKHRRGLAACKLQAAVRGFLARR